MKTKLTPTYSLWETQVLKQTKCEYAIVEALQFIFIPFFLLITHQLYLSSATMQLLALKMLQEGTEEEVETIFPREWF